MIEITKIVEWNMGHRIPNHKSVCRNIHGHRYRLEVTVAGELISATGASDEGMVYDFADLKSLLRDHIYTPLDHVCMYYEHDTLLRDFFESNSDQLTAIRVPFIPTAENIIVWCYEQLKDKLPGHLRISHLKLFETPNSWTQLRF
jgi:6-pyruvoyltetrahydropterin/6-carboxytetrahydropterin synthase